MLELWNRIWVRCGYTLSQIRVCILLNYRNKFIEIYDHALLEIDICVLPLGFDICWYIISIICIDILFLLKILTTFTFLIYLLEPLWVLNILIIWRELMFLIFFNVLFYFQHRMFSHFALLLLGISSINSKLSLWVYLCVECRVNLGNEGVNTI